MPNRTPIPQPPQFKRLLLNAVLVPIIVMIGIAVLLVAQIESLLSAAASAAHSDDVIVAAYELEKFTIDLETGLRGFLVTGVEEFLDPYHNSLRMINGESGAIARLDKLLPATGEERNLFGQINKMRAQWLEYASGQIERKQAHADVSVVERARQGKYMMDETREQFRQLIAIEVQTRKVRDQKVQWASRLSLYLISAVALLGGGFLAVLAGRQFFTLSKVYQRALNDVSDLNSTLETKVEQRTVELKVRSEQLGEANKELEAFAYSISHDLRAPMRHITGFADMLRASTQNKLPEADKINLDTIFDTAKQAGRMVDDLLAFSRVGRTQIRSDPVNLNEIVLACQRELLPEIGSRQIEWVVADLPEVCGDPPLLRMTLSNLMSNAVKYSSKNSIARIEIGIADETQRALANSNGERLIDEADFAGPEPKYTAIFVRDNGVGFDMQYATKLYGVFQRMHRAEDFEGTGIGLANVRRIILRHGGRIWADAAPGKGATFYFSLPLATHSESGDV